MDELTYEGLMELARRFEGRELETVTGRKFTLGVSSTEYCPYFTPASSGYGQTDGRKAAERFVNRFNELHSFRPSDYGAVTRNASYYVGLLLAAERDRIEGTA
jgi:hypothetical protein